MGSTSVGTGKTLVAVLEVRSGVGFVCPLTSLVQQFAHGLRQDGRRKRLLQKVRVFVGRRVGVARKEEDLQPGMHAEQMLREVRSARARQDDIGEKQVKG